MFRHICFGGVYKLHHTHNILCFEHGISPYILITKIKLIIIVKFIILYKFIYIFYSLFSLYELLCIDSPRPKKIKRGNNMQNESITNKEAEKIISEFNMDSDEAMDLIFILDRSGSMGSSESSTIDGFNQFIEKESGKGKETYVSVVLFDDQYEILHTRTPVQEVPVLTQREYFARGLTSLYDAIGRTIESFKDEISNKVLCVIITDGMENSSVRFDRDQIKSYIDEMNWEFVFIGADIDSYAAARNIGIKRSHTSNFSKTDEGIHNVFDACANLSTMHRADVDFNEVDWKDNLEKDL